jgi:hypothetical protein
MLVMGDSRDNLEVFNQTIMGESSLKPVPDLAIHLGDFLGDPTQQAMWPVVLDSLDPLMSIMPVYPVPGNHDIHDAASEAGFIANMPLPTGKPYYRVDMDKMHLIFLDGTKKASGTGEEIAGDQLTWLQAQLDELAASPDFKIVFCHFPVFRLGPGYHTPLDNGVDLHVMFLAAGVQAYFNAPDHVFAHQVIEGIQYFPTGGAGAPLVSGADSYYHFLLLEVGADRIVVKVIGLNNQALDSFIIER